MKVELVEDNYFYFDVIVDNVSFFRHTDLTIKQKLYNKALDLLDFEIQSVASLVKDDSKGIYLWCLTYKDHRVDGVARTVLLYYILSIIKYLKKSQNNIEVVVKVDVPDHLISELRCLGCVVKNKIKFKNRLRQSLSFNFGPIQYLYPYLTNTLLTKKKSLKKYYNSTALVFNLSENFSRLKSYPEKISEKNNLIIVDVSYLKLKEFGTDNIIKLNKINIFVFLKLIVKAFKIKNHIVRYKKLISEHNTFFNIVSKQSYLQTLLVLVKETACENLLKKIKPNKVIVSTTFGDPMKRLPLIVAKRNNIYSTIFACRTFFSSQRSEDRLIKADLENYNYTSIGDEIVVFDKPSISHLNKFRYKGKIKKYSTEIKSQSSQHEIQDGILLLFGGKHVNKGIIELIEYLIHNNIKINNLIYREHPIYKIPKNDVEILNKFSDNIKCITGIAWQDLTFENILTVTCNTTAAVDAVSRGTSLLWLPYISEHSLQSMELISKIGFIAKTKQEAFLTIKNYFGDNNYRDKINSSILKEYNERIMF